MRARSVCAEAGVREQIYRFLVLFWVGMGRVKLPLATVFSADITIILKHPPFLLPFLREKFYVDPENDSHYHTRQKWRTADSRLRPAVLKMHTQIGIDDCSTDLSLRGLPVFRGLIGPMPESKEIVRYEAPEVFESLTKEWGATPTKRKTRRRAAR